LTVKPRNKFFDRRPPAHFLVDKYIGYDIINIEIVLPRTHEVCGEAGTPERGRSTMSKRMREYWRQWILKGGSPPPVFYPDNSGALAATPAQAAANNREMK